jgi:hypothetical protein
VQQGQIAENSRQIAENGRQIALLSQEITRQMKVTANLEKQWQAYLRTLHPKQ